MKRSNLLKAFVVLTIFVSSCDSSVIYEEQKDLSGQQWHKDSVFKFSYDADTLFCDVVKFSFNVRHNVDYAYKNMWLFVKIDIPNKEAIIDTINLEFMDDQGNWLPHVHGGTIKESKHDYRYALSKPPKGEYNIELAQGMRKEILKNVVSIGARIEKLDHD